MQMPSLYLNDSLFFFVFPEVKIDYVPRQGRANLLSSRVQLKPFRMQISVHFDFFSHATF